MSAAGAMLQVEKGRDESTRPPLTTAQTYRAYDVVMRNVERWIASAAPHVAGCDQEHVRARVVQRIVQETAAEYSLRAEVLRDTPGADLSAGGISVGMASGKVTLGARAWLANVGRFAITWLRVLRGLALLSVDRTRASSSAATIVTEAGGGFEDTDREFADFCRRGPIEPLRQASRIVVHAPAGPRVPTDGRLVYSSDLFLGVTRETARRHERWRVLLAHLRAPFIYARAIASHPTAVLLGRDIAVLPVMQWLDRRGKVEAMVTSLSAFMAQPLWMKGMARQGFRLHMTWYSQNFVPKIYAGEPPPPADLPAARHMRVDEHWVWTEGFAAYLRGLGHQGPIRVVGPILWYLPAEVPEELFNGITVVVFDITPFIPAKLAFAAAKNYYSVETISRFMSDITAACDVLSAERGRPVTILVKHKRSLSAAHHDAAYPEFLDSLERTRSGFRLIDHRTNMFGLLAKADISVSVPYTTTAYAAAWVGKPALYHDPFAELVPWYERHPLVHFTAGREELIDAMRRLVP